jgi:dipeptidyl-peptidase-4
MRISALLALTATSASALTQPLPPARGLSLARLNSYPLVHGRSPSGAAMSPDGQRIFFGWNRTGARKLDAWTLDFPNGQPREILKADAIPELPRQDDERSAQEKAEAEEYDGGIGGFQWSPDSQDVMFARRGRTWLMKHDGTNLRALVDGNEGISNPKFSPDGRWIGFIKGGNVYRMSRTSGAIKQITFIGKPGASAEDFLFSPNGETVAIIWGDSSKLGSHRMMDFSKHRAEVVNIRRMWNGELSNDVQIGMAPIDGGLVQFAEGLPRNLWITSLEWSPDGSRLAVFWISEDFQEATISTIRAREPSAYRVYAEKAPKNYIPDFRKLFWSKDGNRLWFTSDIAKGSFTHRGLFSVSLYGTDLRTEYLKDHDIAAAVRPKDASEVFLVTLENPLQGRVKVLNPDGTTTALPQAMEGAHFGVPVDFDEAGLPLISADGRQAAVLASSRSLNPELYAVRPSVKRLTVSQTEEFKKVAWAERREVEFPGPGGSLLRGMLFLPPGRQPGEPRPAFISSMYANSGKEGWGGYFENYAAVELGMVVLQVDFRASWGYGGEFNSGYFKSMGIIDSQEAVAAKEFLVDEGLARPDRVGVWGWSYGGYLTCMIMLTQPEAFDTGVAVASVTDWRSYNEWYTRRRLGLVKDEEAAFKASSPVDQDMTKLAGRLVLIHGMLDDNVLYQDTVRLQERLIRAGKFFETFEYPRGDHGMFRSYERPHIMELILGRLYERLARP